MYRLSEWASWDGWMLLNKDHAWVHVDEIWLSKNQDVTSFINWGDFTDPVRPPGWAQD